MPKSDQPSDADGRRDAAGSRVGRHMASDMIRSDMEYGDETAGGHVPSWPVADSARSSASAQVARRGPRARPGGCRSTRRELRAAVSGELETTSASHFRDKICQKMPYHSQT